MSNDPNSRLYAVFREHPALIVSALYVAASVIGMFYSWAFLRFFGVNVFNYAHISDFLLASLKEPFTWALVILAVSLVLLDNASSRQVQRKGPRKWLRWYGSPRYRFVNNFAAIYIVLSFIYIFASFQARDVKEDEGKRVDVTFAEGGASQPSVLLGTTGQFVILYDAAADRVDIHPIESIHSISFQAE
ncbi:MAG: hypothetical protein MJA32_11210 [Proteobacteria bacterium]|nr:hypothetical protein [Pseudomonadota bacterium]